MVPRLRNPKWPGTQFNVKKATVTANARQTVIKGQLSHHLSFRPDDQVYYTIVKSNGKVISLDIKIDRGGLAPYASKFASFFIGKELADGDLQALLQNLGRRVDGNWESAADLIIATIALKAPDRTVARTTGGVVRDHRTPIVVRDHRN